MPLADLALPGGKIEFIKAQYYTEGRTAKVIAFVNHRMVGYLAGTDSYFQHPDRPVSTHFGIGYGKDGVVQIHQYVPLDDTAFGNGNYDPSGNWDDWGYPLTHINAQTVNIEHQDHGDPGGRGIVSDKTQSASIKLQALLRYGSKAQWQAAGIVLRDWDHNYTILRDEFRAIPVNGRHIITHHDIAGNLKPTCWLPWDNDKQGFPRTKYVKYIPIWGDRLVNGYPDPVPVPDPDPVPVPEAETFTKAQLDAAVAAAVSEATAAQAVANAQLTETNNILRTKINTARTALA